MPYLSFDEYKEYGFNELEESDFDRLLSKAIDVIDQVTNHFYRFNDLEPDFPYRKHQFKKAIGAQLQHFHEVGASSIYGMREPQSVSIGRTSMSSGNSSGSRAEPIQYLSSEAVNYLSGTGLLYRGLRV